MSKRFLCDWANETGKPVIYHCISRVVDRRFVLGDEEREKFRVFMRMQENFSGCRVLSYCLMSNHIHILLEVPPMPEGGISDEDLLKRLSAIWTEAAVEAQKKELADARKAGNEEMVAEIHARHTYRMHNLSEYMRTVLHRFTCWFNRTHKRTGTLWEQRFKSVIVESGTAARMMAAYIDLNPVRAGMVADPADYRWCSYGEAVGGGRKGNGKKAREGLVRAIESDTDAGFDASLWNRASKTYRMLMGMALERKPSNATVMGRSEQVEKTLSAKTQEANQEVLPELKIAKILSCRVRYFTDGAVIGSKDFVNEAFSKARERFSEYRKDGARPLRGNAREARGQLWSARDLKV
jgi:putative transposase